MRRGVILITIFLILFGGLAGWKYFQKIENKKFLSQMKGKIVFVKRDNGVLSIYKINADGTGLKKLYRHQDEINPNSRLPKWSIEGKQIYFKAMKEGKWETFVMNENGEEVRVVLDTPLIPDQKTKQANLIIQQGNLYWKDNTGKLHLIYHHPFQNYKFNPGASEASWSPDKEYIVFQVCGFFKGCRIMIANKQGKVVELTKGRQPDWKY